MATVGPLRIVAYGALVLLASLLLISMYFDRQERAALRTRLDATIVDLASNPLSRPLAWTSTMDDRRTLKLCEAILKVPMEIAQAGAVFESLPEVCRNRKATKP